MTPDQAADLAARTLAAIDQADRDWFPERADIHAADRERVASDLAGIEECWRGLDHGSPLTHTARYVAGLVRTAALYGVKP